MTLPALSWPPAPHAPHHRPWTRWWWMGNATTPAEISTHLNAFHAAGIGGVEISPIYGVTGDEARYVEYLSPQWVALLAHTITHARALGMDADMILGTGWPFGGPWVAPADAPVRLAVESFPVGAGGADPASLRAKDSPVAAPVAVTAHGPNGETLPVDAHAGKWTPPAPGAWVLYAAFMPPTGQQVKRAAPGGAGHVLDHFAPAAWQKYLAHFTERLAGLPPGLMPRTVFNDSYEVFGADTTPAVFDAFRRRRGYDLRLHLPALRGDGDKETATRVRSDYRQTVGELFLEGGIKPFTAWANSKGARSRNQAHGSPGNLLDLYAAADIPETEIFGPIHLRQSGLTPLTEFPDEFGDASEDLICRMASSAAHIAGKPLCSSESFTWLGEHGRVPLEHIKTEIDTLFTLGINHIFFHGTPLSPPDAPWPGHLFYAATHFGPTNPFWHDLPAVNAYIARSQAILQSGQPDSDVLLYFPFFDVLARDDASKSLLRFLTVHATKTWMAGDLPGCTRAARVLTGGGWGFDFVSDALLHSAVTVGAGGTLDTAGGCHARAVVVPSCDLLPAPTAERLHDLAHAGATVIFVTPTPHTVPGWADHDAHQARLSAALAPLGLPVSDHFDGVIERAVGQGRVLIGADLAALLHAANVAREPVAESGLEWVRRREADGSRTYFLSNPGKQAVRATVPLGGGSGPVIFYDPLTEALGVAHTGGGETHLHLLPGQSCFAHCPATTPAALPAPWLYAGETVAAHPVTGPWQVTFTDGGPALPAPRTVAALSSWTDWQGGDTDALRAFSGTAVYRTTFDLPLAPDQTYTLHLGEVCHSARVRLNGVGLGTVFARPWQTALPAAHLTPTGNTLEIKVTNLMANRLADLDRRKVEWKKFLFVTINYKPFNASGWPPVASGLVGPVQIVAHAKSVL